MDATNDGVCQGCFVYWFKLNMWHAGLLPADMATVARVQASAYDGCPCCRIVADGMAAMSPAWLARAQSSPISVLWRISTSISTNTFVPTRVLNVDSSEDDRIVLGENAPASASYVAVSYCWGPDANGAVTTKNTNVAVRTDTQRGIILTTLPRTIQDTMLACR